MRTHVWEGDEPGELEGLGDGSRIGGNVGSVMGNVGTVMGNVGSVMGSVGGVRTGVVAPPLPEPVGAGAVTVALEFVAAADVLLGLGAPGLVRPGDDGDVGLPGKPTCGVAVHCWHGIGPSESDGAVARHEHPVRACSC